MPTPQGEGPYFYCADFPLDAWSRASLFKHGPSNFQNAEHGAGDRTDLGSIEQRMHLVAAVLSEAPAGSPRYGRRSRS